MSTIPMNTDIPSNSQKAQEEAKANKKPEIVPFDGQTAGVVRKKFSFWKWFKKNFLGDQKPKDIMKNVVEQQIVPGIKDNFRNSMVSSLDMFIYQNSRPVSQSGNNNGIQYNNIFRSQSTTTAVSAQSQPQPAAQVDTNGGFCNPCFKNRNDADRFLTQMKVYDYPTLSVHTMYMMQHRHIDYTWDAYGWTREEIAKWDSNKVITHINNPDWPWMLDLPQAHLIS